MLINERPQAAETWAFSSIFPLYYRCLILPTIGIWAWGLNLQILSLLNIDVASILHMSHLDKQQGPMHKPVYSIATTLSILVSVNLWSFWATMDEQHKDSTIESWLPLFCYTIVILMLTWPGNAFYKKERVKFWRSIRRILSLDMSAEVFFSDVILADILTSFAKVLGDLWPTACALLIGKGSTDFLVNESGSGSSAWGRGFMSPLLTSIPYMIRFRQCIAEYKQSKFSNRRSLYNAFKYASAFPVIFFSALQKRSSASRTQYLVVDGGEDVWISDSGLFRLWLFFVILNSLYSFYWDVFVDWNLFGSPIGAPEKTLPFSFKFRTNLFFSEPLIYYFAIFIDLLLRTTWSLKLSSHLYIAQLDWSIFLMELLEVIRRWVWVYFRIENEWVRRGSGSFLGNAVEMGRVDGKMDD